MMSKTLVPAIVMVLAAGVAFADDPQQQPPTLNELSKEHDRLREENARLRDENARLREAHQQMTEQIAQMEARMREQRGVAVDQTQEQLSLRDENTALRARLEVVESARQDLESERTRLEQLAGMTTKGELVESKVALIRTTYDADADRTTIASTPERIDGPGGLATVEHRMSLACSYPGKQPGPAAAFHFDILTRANVDDRYKNLRSVELVIDGQTHTVPVAAYEVLASTSRQTSTRPGGSARTARAFDERLRLELDRAAVNRISNAADVRVVLYRTTYTLTRENIATFVALRERLDLPQ
jgi:TolA-binding protein